MTPRTEVTKLTSDTCLVGVDGWYDGRYSLFENSNLGMSDFELIREFKAAGHIHNIWKLSRVLADGFASNLTVQLEDAINKGFKTVIVLTHIPPFPENSTYRGKMSDSTWMPYFSSKATGDVLLEYAKNNPFVTFKVYCGHSHGKAYFSPRLNLVCKTAEAEYKHPTISEIIVVE